MIRYSYWIACLSLLIAGFLIIAFAKQEILDSGEISGEMPVEAGFGGLLIQLSLAGMFAGASMKLFIYLKKRRSCLK